MNREDKWFIIGMIVGMLVCIGFLGIFFYIDSTEFQPNENNNTQCLAYKVYKGGVYYLGSVDLSTKTNTLTFYFDATSHNKSELIIYYDNKFIPSCERVLKEGEKNVRQ